VPTSVPDGILARHRAFSYTTVKNILASAQDRIAIESDVPAKEATHTHDNIRGGTYYAATKEHEC
jgi:hypothetical protein